MEPSKTQLCLDERLRDFIASHSICTKIGPSINKDYIGEPYVILCSYGIKDEGSLPSGLWHPSCSELMIDQYFESLKNWLSTRNFIVWRQVPQVCDVDLYTRVHESPQEDRYREHKMQYIYSRLTAY